MIQTEINTVYKSHILILSAGKQIYMNGPWVVGDLIVRHLEYKFNSLTTPPIRGPTFNSKAKQECQLKRDKRELLGICTARNFNRINASNTPLCTCSRYCEFPLHSVFITDFTMTSLTSVVGHLWPAGHSKHRTDLPILYQPLMQAVAFDLWNNSASRLQHG